MATQTIESVLNETRTFAPDAAFVKQANISGMDAYNKLCAEAERDFTGFWARLARENVLWHKPFTQTLDESNAPFYKWFADGTVNASYNCLDRHLKTQGDKVAIIFEADDGKVTKITYKELHRRVCMMANGLKSLNIKKGDRVLIYMPMSVEAVVAMQACARVGAIHSVVFGGFSAKSVQERIIDAGAVAVLTADEQMRGGKPIALKAAVDEALSLGGCDSIKHVVVYKRTGGQVKWTAAARRMAARARGQAGRNLRARVGRSRPSAVHPLYLRLDRQAQRRAALDRRLPAARDSHHEMDVRLQSERRVLVHGRRRLGHGPYLRLLRAACGRRDRDRFRRRAHLSGFDPLLAHDPGPQSKRVLHRTHRDPVADQARRATCRKNSTSRRCAFSAPSASRSIPKPGCGTTKRSANRAARSSTRGGRRKPAGT